MGIHPLLQASINRRSIKPLDARSYRPHARPLDAPAHPIKPQAEPPLLPLATTGARFLSPTSVSPCSSDPEPKSTPGAWLGLAATVGTYLTFVLILYAMNSSSPTFSSLSNSPRLWSSRSDLSRTLRSPPTELRYPLDAFRTFNREFRTL